MKVLTLSIKQKWFDEIIAGTKTVETREIRPNNFTRYARFVHKGKEYLDIDEVPTENESEIDVVPVKYDAIKLLTGEYKGTRPYAIIEVKKAEIIFLTDDNGKDIVYEQDGRECYAAVIEYTLGKIIEKHIINP